MLSSTANDKSKLDFGHITSLEDTLKKVDSKSDDIYDSFGNTVSETSTENEGNFLYECESVDDGVESFRNTPTFTGKTCELYKNLIKLSIDIEDKNVANNSATFSHLMKLSQTDYSEPSGQCRLLLVSLLDNFCSMYDKNPRKNQKLFSSLCRKLSSMGILKTLDFMEESKSVRSVYREAFKSIVLDAVKSIENERASFDDSKLGSRAQSLESIVNNDDQALVEQHTFNHFLNNSKDTSIPSSYAGEEIFLSGRSRYREDFIEGGVVGRGGYGKVVVASNKLDGNSYAIKKISFSGVASNRFTRILREVKSLARLDHPNIVRYNSAWIEDHSVILERIEAEANDKSQTVIHELKNESNVHFSENQSDSEVDDTFTSGLSSEDLIADGNCNEDSSSVSHKSDRTHVICFQSSHSMNGNHCSEDHPSPSRLPHQHFQFQDRKIMYIQMELCRFTLDQYIKARNAFYFECLEEIKRTGRFPEDRANMSIRDKIDRCFSIASEKLFNWNPDKQELNLNLVEIDFIFKGIVKGLHYIHENGMIHRDLKPMNIFFHHDLTPKIGDFGLVSEIKCSCGYNCGPTKSEDGSKNSIEFSPLESYSHTKGVGTVTYASPEQLLQKDYTQKSDIYSLGIICFELFYPVATQMERTRVLTDLKQRHKFPESFLKKWPKEAAFIWSCIARDSEVRPSTHEILESEWLERDQDDIISRLETELSISRKREEDLIKKLKESKKENITLKKLLKTNKT